MTDNSTNTFEYLEAGCKLSERDRLRSHFIMGEAAPPWVSGHPEAAALSRAENFLAELLADPEKAAAAAPFFPQILGLTPPSDLSAAPEQAPPISPWADALADTPAEVAAPEAACQGLSPADSFALMDFNGRVAALLNGAAVIGVAPLAEAFVLARSWDGRPVVSGGGHQADFNGPAARLPVGADRVLVLGFVRTPAVMGMNPGLSTLRPAGGWLDWPGQIAAVLKLAGAIAARGYLAVPSAGGLLRADHLGVLAGLGELGRQGLLITPEYGPNLRLFTIITNYPFLLDRPLLFGVADYCETCQRCINECPAKAIGEGRRRPGLYQWPVNRRACFDNWLEKRDPCRKCIEICPYTREPLAGSAK